MHHYDLVVVGGGLAGLTAANLAAREGRSVLVLERRAEPGGRARTDILDGFAFNQGAHALYRQGDAMRVLTNLGVSPAGGTPPLGGVGYLNGRVGPLATGPLSLATTRLLRPRSRLALLRVLARVRAAKPEGVDSVPLGEWVDGVTRDADVRHILLALGRLTSYANAPDLVSAGAVLRQIQAGFGGVLYLDGGWGRLVARLRVDAERAGVTVRCSTRVRAVGPDGGHLVVSNDGDGDVDSTAVILAGLSPPVAADLLGLPDEKFEAAGPSAEAAVLDLGLGRSPAERFVLGIDEPTYFSVHGPPAAMAPEGMAAAVAMKYLPVGSDTEIDADREDLERVAALAGIQDVRQRRFLRRMTVTHGMPLAAQSGLAGRPPVSVPEVPGVFVAGDWVGSQGMLADAALASAATAAQAALAHLSSRQRLVTG